MIDCFVEGSVSDVKSGGTWLRATLQANLSDAADSSASARKVAAGEWEGKDADAYSTYASNVVKLTDEHADRVGRAAQAYDSYATRLQTMKTTMDGLTGRAVAGGLEVAEYVIYDPPSVPPATVEPGSPEEAAHKAAVDKVELYNTLDTEATAAWKSFEEWVAANLVPDVADAQETGDVSDLMGEIVELFPNFLAGVTAGFTGIGLAGLADKYKDAAREYKRKSRVSGDPRVRGRAKTPKGLSYLDDLLRKARWLGKFGKIFAGPVGIGIDIGFGIYDGIQTGDWTRAALTTGASIAVGVGIGALVAAGVVTAPAWAVVLGAGVLAAGAAWGVGKIYDNWDDITGWTGNALSGAGDFASDTWDSATDLAGDTWDAVTPW